MVAYTDTPAKKQEKKGSKKDTEKSSDKEEK